MIEAIDISLTLNGKKILDEITLSINTGEFVAIMGANGAGKSSLVSILSADQPATSGRILFNDHILHGYKLKQLARLRAVMPQHNPLSFPFKAWEVVAMGRTPYDQFPRNREREIALEMLEFTSAEFLSEREYPSLSGGEKQRVQLARVLNQVLSSSESKRYLFLDECTSSLDPAHQHIIFGMLMKLKSLNLGIVAIVHDINLAAHYCDRVVLLKNGEILVDASTPEALSPNNIKRAYGLNSIALEHPEGNWNIIAAAREAVDEPAA